MSHQVPIDAKQREIRLKYRRTARRRGGGGNFRLGEARRLLRHRGTPEHEIDNEIVNKLSHDVWQWSRAQAGEMLGLTFDEKVHLGIRTMMCFDEPEAKVRAHYADQKRARDRAQKARRRATARAAPKALSERAHTISDVLSAGGWLSAPDLVAHATELRSFRKGHGRPLDAEARRQAVHRALKELSNAGKIDTEKRAGEHGLQVVFVRLRQ